MDTHTLGIVKAFVAKSAPRAFVHYASKRPFRHIGLDENNFSDPATLRTALLGFDVVSFDFFDTLVHRTISLSAVKDKSAQFGREIVRWRNGHSPEQLLSHCRTRFSERYKQHLMQLPGDEYRNEVPLTELFERALVSYIPEKDEREALARALVEFEVRTEMEVLKPDPHFVALLKFLRDHGKTTLLVSDMYLEHDHMIDILDHIGLSGFFDHVFISATVGVTKNSGKLFSWIDEKLGLNDVRRVHVGDNYLNDFIRPREQGWQAFHYFRRESEEKRLKLELDYKLDSVSYRTRFDDFLADYLKKDGLDTVRVIAGAFCVFANRALERAVQIGAKRLYFLTRDGTIFRDVCEEIVRERGQHWTWEPPEFRVLATSRRNAVLLSYPETLDRGWLDHYVGWLVGVPPTLGSIMKAFALRPVDLRGLSAKEIAIIGRCHDRVDAADLDLEALKAYPGLEKSLNAALCKKKHEQIDYLEQEWVFDRAEVKLLVDIGYSGTIAKFLSQHLFAQMGADAGAGGAIEMALFASNRFYRLNQSEMHPRIVVPKGIVVNDTSPVMRSVSANFSWLEPFTLDPSIGSLQGYDRLPDGTLTPRFGAAHQNPKNDELRSRITSFAAEYLQSSRRANLPSDVIDRMFSDHMGRHFSNPTSETVQFMKSLTHDSGLGNSNYAGIVRRISLMRLRQDIARAMREDAWLQGSLRDSGLSILVPVLNLIVKRATQ